MSGEVSFEAAFDQVLRDGPLQWVRIQGIKLYVKDHWLNPKAIKCPKTQMEIAPNSARIITFQGCEEVVLVCPSCQAFHFVRVRSHDDR